MTRCPKTAREGRYQLTCCREQGHDGDCWAATITIDDAEHELADRYHREDHA